MGVIALQHLPWRKILSVAAVFVLHVAIVAVLLEATIVRSIFKPVPRETILLLRPPKREVKRVEPPARRIVPVFRLQKWRGITLPQTNDSAKSPGLGLQLFDCRIENISKLTEEQRALCARSSSGLMPDDSVDFADRSAQVRGAGLWARQKARKNAPGLLPCASNRSAYATLSTATLLCLANGVINGIDLDARPMYDDEPEKEIHLPNNGDPPPPYTSPDH